MNHDAFVAALGALLPSFVLLHLSDKALVRALPPQCNDVLDAHFFLSADEIYPHLACMGDEGRAMYLDFYLFDLVMFPLIYSMCLAGVLARLWPSARMLPVLAAAADVVENVCMCVLLNRFPERNEWMHAVVSVLTRTKWTFVFISVAAVVVGLVRRALSPKRTTHASPKPIKSS